jgi:hypothetical protein
MVAAVGGLGRGPRIGTPALGLQTHFRHVNGGGAIGLGG